MLKRVLIANRGEIALRIVRACEELGIESVAIFSDVDRYALHVKRASQALPMGPHPLDAYLNGQQIIDAALANHCDAIHPGYGFLSENAEFARAVSQAGLVFIGPDSEVIAKMGSKTRARQTMIEAGIPVIPGSEESLDGLIEAKVVADDIGYPIMLKAKMGGGGRGIRLCHNPAELEQAFPRVKSEALKFFANDDLFIEKFIESPRHIEVQILADHFGNVVHLFERDCSLQRRHQKLIEIAPAPKLSVETRRKLYQYAIRASQKVAYKNAGTVEFLVDLEENIYFLEMNTRLQVEHPVTEAITGIDIVQTQLLIASGQPLGFKQSQIQCNGFAIEYRINAEDPKSDFMPSFGKITKYYAPGGPGVRTDSAVYTGYFVPKEYDSLCAKLTVWALDWASVINRSKRALEEMRLYGVKTTISFYLQILEDPTFKQGLFATSFIEKNPHLTDYSQKMLPNRKAAVIAAVLSQFKI
jgi:pyruvate carboxylase subunit A